ncbi:hypothetical protein LJC07_06890 [Christensenellaceae bacterium OttesenSCG-928-L17]|nr:hypothetical protein [Christensenellaceae bacterium OttesenSCG-928-L17]
MKIFQILNGFCHWDATRQHPTLASTQGRYAPDIVFVEAPDYVFEGWGYTLQAEGDARFLPPPLPEPAMWTDEETGETYHWVYDNATGTFYIADAGGAPVLPMHIHDAHRALKDAKDALALLGVEQEDVDEKK